jgi:hypothetical protein
MKRKEQKMKVKVLGILVLIVIAFVGCANDLVPQKGYGTIILKLPSNDSKGLITEELAHNASSYSLYAYNSETVLAADANVGSTEIKMNVPIGTYTVMAFAGEDKGGMGRFMYGAGITKQIEVKDGQKTPVTVTLKKLDFDFSVSTTDIECSSKFKVTLNGDLRLPELYVMAGNSYINLGPGNNQNYPNPNYEGTIWDGSMEFQAPATEGTGTLSYWPAWIKVRDIEYNQDFPLSVVGNVWVVPAVKNSIDVQFVPIKSGITYTLEWE